MRFEILVRDFGMNPFSTETSFALASAYEELNQKASAVSFFLRTIEYGYKKDISLTYVSLIKIARILQVHHDKSLNVTNSLLQAISYCPERPEAYFHLAQFYGGINQWQECYTWASLGYLLPKQEPLPVDVDYHGSHYILLEKAIAAWSIGRKEESLGIFGFLEMSRLPKEFLALIKQKLNLLVVSNVDV